MLVSMVGVRHPPPPHLLPLPPISPHERDFPAIFDTARIQPSPPSKTPEGAMRSSAAVMNKVDGLVCQAGGRHH